jgi:hypothetical protein
LRKKDIDSEEKDIAILQGTKTESSLSAIIDVLYHTPRTKSKQKTSKLTKHSNRQKQETTNPSSRSTG